MRHHTSPRPLVSKRNAKRICQAAIATAAILSGPIYAQNVSWIGGGADGLWATDTNWDFGFPPGLEDIAVFSLAEASTINLGGIDREVAGLSFTVANVYKLTNGGLILNSLAQTGNANNEIQVTVKTKNNGADILNANVTTNTLQLQRLVTAGGITKTGAGTLRLGTSATDFTNAINGDIVINAGTLQAAANNQAAGNPLGGTGKIQIGATGVTLSLQAQANMDFGREVVANNNSFTLRGEAAAADTGDFTTSIGKISIGTATLTATTGAGYSLRTSELAISPGSTTTVTTNNFFNVAKLTGDSTTKIVKNGASDLRIQANALNATDFQGDIDVAAGWLVLEGNGGGQPLGSANTQINITGAGSTVSLRADAAQTFNGVNINAGNNNFNFDIREITGQPASATLTAGSVTIGNATMSVTGRRHNLALSSLTLNAGATSIINVNSADTGSQNLRVESLIGDDPTTTLQKNGGQTLTIGTGPSTNFKGKVIVNGGTLTVESTSTVNALANAQSLTFINGSTLNLRGAESADYAVPIRVAPGVLSSTISADRTGTTASGNTFTLGDVNPSGATLTLNSGNNYGYVLDSVTVDAGATGALNIGTNGTGVVNVDGLNLPANSTLNKTGNSTMVIRADQSATATGAINVRVGTLTAGAAGAFGKGLITVGNTTPNTAGFLNDFSRVNWSFAGASSNTNGVDAVVVSGGVLDLNAVPDANDIFDIKAEGRIQGNAVQLQGLTVGANVTLAPNAIIVHEEPNSTGTINGLANNAELFYGLANNTSVVPTIGVGTPWKGLSSDNAGRTIQGVDAANPTAIRINGGDNNTATIEATIQSMSDQSFNFGGATGGYTWTSTAAGGEKVTLAIRGVLGTSNLGLVPGGRVIFNRDAASTGLINAVDKIVVQSGSLALLANNALGTTALGTVPVEVLSGGSLDIGATTGAAISADATIKSGGVLYLNDNVLLTGTGTIKIEGGGKLDITGSAPADILSASSQAINFEGTGHTVRFAANNIVNLDARVPNGNVTFVVGGGTSQTTAFPETNIGSTGTPLLVNSQNASVPGVDPGLSLDNGILTNAGSNTAYVGPIRLNNTDLTLAATRGTTFIIANEVKTTGNIQIGSLTPIDGRDKSLNSTAVNSLGVPDPYNGGSQVIITGGFAANSVTVNNSLFALANADTTVTGDLTVNGAVLYLDGGGPLNVTGATQGQLTTKLSNGTLANQVVLNNYSRVEMRLDLPSDSNATRLNVNQAFVINGDINPLDNRRFYVSRNSGTNNAVNFNNITLMPNSVFGVQEDNTDVRASLKLAGNATVSTTNSNSSIDYINISRDASLPAYDGTNPVILTQGRLNVLNWQGSNTTNSNVFGKIDAGVEVNLVRGQMFFVAGSTLDGVVRTQTAAVGGDSFVLSTSNSTDNTLTTPTSTGGIGRIELGRSGAANGPEDFEIRGTETTNAATTEAPLHTHTGEIRVVNDGDNTSIDGIVRSSRVNDSDRTARVQVDKIVLESGATVQLTNANAIPLTVTGITLQGDGTINTAATGMTVNGVNAGTNTVTFTGAQALNLTSGITAGHVKVDNTTLNIPTGLTGPLTVNGGNATTNGSVNGAVNVTGGTATVVGSVQGSLNVTTGTATFDAAGGTQTVTGPVTLDGGNIAVVNGNLDLSNTVITSTASRTVAGLREGRVAGAFNTAAGNTSNVVKLGPVMAQLTTGWGTNETYVYTGQLLVPNNNGDGTGTLAFAENFDDSVRVTIDGAQRLNNGTWNDATGTGGITLSAGWHDVEFRFGQGTGGAGPNVNDGWNATLGFGIDLDTADFDPAGTNPVQSKYVAPLDNGSMSLFRTSVASNLVVTDGTLRTGGFNNIGKIALGGFSQFTLNPTGGAAVLSAAESIDVAANATARLEVTRAGDRLTVDRLNLGADLTVAGAGNVTVNGNSTGAFSLIQDLTGVLTINGSISGGTFVNSGTLRGNATLKDVVLNGGKLAPGQSPGIMKATTLSALDMAAFEFEIGGGLTAGAAVAGVDFDQLIVSGEFLDLGNATLSLILNSALHKDDVLTLILNNGTDDAGTFAGLANGAFISLANGYEVQISYFDDASTAAFELAGGNDVSVLVTVPEPTTAMALLGGLATLAGMSRFRRRNS